MAVRAYDSLPVCACVCVCVCVRVRVRVRVRARARACVRVRVCVLPLYLLYQCILTADMCLYGNAIHVFLDVI